MAYASLADTTNGPAGYGFSSTPQPFQVQQPNQGFFRAVGDNTMSQIFKKNADNSISAYTISDWGNQGNDLFTQQERAPGAMYSMYGPGGSYGLARTRLQSQYGLDVSKLPEYNIGDLRSAGSTVSGFSGSLKDFLGTSQPAATQGSVQTLNGPGTSMAPATPEQIAAQKANPAYFSPQQAQAQADTQRTAAGLTPQTAPGGASSVPGTGPGGAPLQPTAPPVPGTQPAQPGTQPGTQPAGTNLYAGAANYKGPSIVDFLSYAGQPNSFADRAQLAAKMGIQNYTGTAAQNTQMLNTLRGQTAGGALGGAGGTGTTGSTSQTGQAGGAGGAGTSPDQTPGTDAFNQRVTSLMSQWGVKPADSSQSPVTAFADTYKQILQNMGIPSIKEEFDKLQKRYSDLLDEKAVKEKDINSNPWISESLRLKELKALGGAYENRINGLTNQMKLYESMYTKGQEEARFVAQQGMMVSHQGTQFNDQLMLKAIDIAEKEMFANQKLSGSNILTPNEAKTLGVKYGTTRTQAQQMGIIPQRWKPGTVKSGSLTISSSDVSKGASMLLQSGQKYANPYVYDQMANHWVSKGGTVQGFLNQYPPKQWLAPKDRSLIPSWINVNQPTTLPKTLTPKTSSPTSIPITGAPNKNFA